MKYLFFVIVVDNVVAVVVVDNVVAVVVVIGFAAAGTLFLSHQQICHQVSFAKLN